MWECSNCGYKKNNNNSLKCHGKNCKSERPFGVAKEKRVYDLCPKCLHETYWKPAKFHQKYMKANGQMARKWIKVWKCEECGRHAKMIGSPIKTSEQIMLEERENAN